MQRLHANLRSGPVFQRLETLGSPLGEMGGGTPEDSRRTRFNVRSFSMEILRHLSRGEKYNFYVSLLIIDKKGTIFGRLDGQSLVGNPLRGGTLLTDFHRTQSKDIPLRRSKKHDFRGRVGRRRSETYGADSK
jgi:hypothetical protein